MPTILHFKLLQNQKRQLSQKSKKYYVEPEELGLAAEPVVKYMTAKEIDKLIDQAQKSMEKAAKELNFVDASRLRDEWLALKKMKE